MYDTKPAKLAVCVRRGTPAAHSMSGSECVLQTGMQLKGSAGFPGVLDERSSCLKHPPFFMAGCLPCLFPVAF